MWYVWVKGDCMASVEFSQHFQMKMNMYALAYKYTFIFNLFLIFPNTPRGNIYLISSHEWETHDMPTNMLAHSNTPFGITWEQDEVASGWDPTTDCAGCVCVVICVTFSSAVKDFHKYATRLSSLKTSGEGTIVNQIYIFLSGLET